MAETSSELKVIISAVDRATAVIAGVTAALGSLYGTYKFIEEAVGEASKQEDAEVRLASALRQVSSALKDQSDEMQKNTRYADEVVIGAQATIATFAKNEQQVRRLTAAAADMAAGLGMDLNQAAFLLGKTFESNTNILSRYGLAVNGAAGSGDRLDSIIASINAKMGGQAEAQAKSFSGTWDRLKNSFGELSEAIGNAIVKNPAVIAAMEMLNETFSDLSEELGDNQLALRNLVKNGLAYAVEGVGWLVKGIGWLTIAWDSTKVAANAAIAVIAGALARLYDGLRFALMPLDLLMQGLVKLGAIDANPFDGIQTALYNFADSSEEVFDQSVEQWGKTKDAIDPIANSLIEASDKIRAVSVENETQVAEAVANTTRLVIESTFVSLQAYADFYKAKADLAAADDQFSQEAWAAAYDVAAMEWAMKLEQLQASKASEAEINLAYDTMMTQQQVAEINRRKQVRDAELAGAGSMMASFTEIFATLYKKGGDNARKYFTLYKAAAISETIISTASAAMKAMSQFGAFGWPAAAAITALGALKVQLINRQKFDGGGGDTGGGEGAQPVYPVNPNTGFPNDTTTNPNQNPSGVTHVTVNINNPLSTQNWDEIIERDVIPALNAAGARGVS